MPVPDRLDVCGLPKALLLTCNVPVSTPVPVGVKITLIVHLDFAARLDVQVVAEMLKFPVVEAETLVSAAVSLFVNVNVFANAVPLGT